MKPIFSLNRQPAEMLWNQNRPVVGGPLRLSGVQTKRIRREPRTLPKIVQGATQSNCRLALAQVSLQEQSN